MKCCRVCKLEKEDSEFRLAKTNRDRLSNRCMPCDSNYAKEYRLANLSRLKDSAAKYYEANAARIKGSVALRRQQFPDKVAEEHKRSISKNRERLLAYKKQWYTRNIASLTQKFALRYKSLSKEKLKENFEAAAAWKRNHPAARSAAEARRRARKRGAGGTHNPSDVLHILSLQKGKCAICRVNVRKYHVDHIYALSNGGDNSPKNLQILCPSCNLKKHSRDPVAFMQMNGYLI